MNSGFRGVIRSAITRVRDDGKEILSDVSRWKSAQKKETKPINVWVAAFIVILVVPSAYLALPMILGVFGIVFQQADPDAIQSVSQEALVGLILVATALGALMLWFAGISDESGRKRIKLVGQSFLLAALALSIFMLLSPSLPYIREDTSSYAVFIKFVSVIFLIGGSVSFAWAALLGLFVLPKL